jgi:hypothetical protein
MSKNYHLKLTDQVVCDYIVDSVNQMPASYKEKHSLIAGLFGVGTAKSIDTLQKDITLLSNLNKTSTDKLNAMCAKLQDEFEKLLKSTLKKE